MPPAADPRSENQPKDRESNSSGAPTPLSKIHPERSHSLLERNPPDSRLRNYASRVLDDRAWVCVFE